MKIRHREGILRTLLVMILLLLPMACGAPQSGTPGSWGQDKTNMCVGVSLIPASTTLQADLCNTASSTALANITALKINPALPDNTLTLTAWSVTYQPVTAGAPPIASLSGSMNQLLPVSGISLTVLDAARKQAFLNDITVGGYTPASAFPQYNASYTLSGVDQYGSSFGTVFSLSFTLGQYTVCTLSVLPTSISTSGFLNPDLDTSDDFTLHIYGGVPPYSVISNNSAVIASPGALGAGVTSVTLDPQNVAADKTFTLTAQDGGGQTAVCTVTVTFP